MEDLSEKMVLDLTCDFVEMGLANKMDEADNADQRIE